MVVETTYAVFIIAFLIVILNGLLLAGLQKKFKRAFTTYDLFLVSFTIANLIQGVVTYPFTIYTFIAGKNTAHWQCVTSAALMLLCSISTIWHLVVLSFERFFSLKYPLVYANHNKSPLWRIFGVALPWIVGFVWSITPICGWNSYVVEFKDRPNCNIDLRDHTYNGKTYLYSIFAFNYVIPIAAFLYFFYNVWIELRSLSRMASQTVGSESRITKKTLKTERTQTILIFVMVISFIIVWTPYAILVFYRTVANNEIEINLYETASVLAKVSCILNPVIYGFVYKDIRTHVRMAISNGNKVADVMVVSYKSNEASTSYQSN